MLIYTTLATEMTEPEDEFLLPRRPETPLDSDCCHTDCTLCVFDIHTKAVEKWKRDCDVILSGSIQMNNDESLLMPFEYKKFKLQEIIEDTQNCKIYRFVLPDICDKTLARSFFINFPVSLGQHLILKLENVTRPFTVLRVNRESFSFDILIRIYEGGKFTSLLNKVGVKEEISMRGPFGDNFTYSANSCKSLTLLVAGTGIAPFWRIIEKILGNEDDETRINFLFTCKCESEILIKKQLQEWSRFWNFKITYFLTSESNEMKCSSLYSQKVLMRRISKEDLLEFVDDSTFLVCGTRSFEKDMLKYLTSFNVPDCRIRMF